MSDRVNAGNSYEQSQQEMESGEVEIVDSGQVSKLLLDDNFSRYAARLYKPVR